MATELTADQLQSLLSALTSWEEQAQASRPVPAYDPDFPGLHNEPLHQICPPPPSPPNDGATPTLVLDHLEARMTPARLEHFLRYTLQRPCTLLGVQVYLHKDQRHCWALVTWATVEQARYVLQTLRQQPPCWDGAVLRADFYR